MAQKCNIIIKGAAKLYLIYYLHAVIILFSTGLYKSAFSNYSFGKLGDGVYVFFCVFCHLYVFDSMSSQNT